MALLPGNLRQAWKRSRQDLLQFQEEEEEEEKKKGARRQRGNITITIAIQYNTRTTHYYCTVLILRTIRAGTVLYSYCISLHSIP